MDCLLETKVEVSLEGKAGVEPGLSTDCKYDCRGEIIISVGAGVLVGALVFAAGRWAIRYLVMGHS